MIKKYVMIMSVLLVMLMFTSTSTATFLFPKERIYEGLQENSAFKRILDKLSQIASSNDDGVFQIDTDEDDGEYDDEPDGEYDDGEWDDNEVDDGMVDSDDSLEKDGPLPKIWEEDNIVGEKTLDDGNEPVDDGEIVWNNGTVDSDGDEGVVSNEITIPDYIDEGEWTVDLEQVVEIVTGHNVKLGEMLQRVVERTFALGTVENDVVGGVVVEGGENDIVDVVIEGESMGTPGEDIADVIVLTDGD